jgi:hypothetical protein
MIFSFNRRAASSGRSEPHTARTTATRSAPAAATAARLTDEQATLADQLGVDRDAYAKALAAQG